jgi:cell division control protein 24
MLSVSTNIGRKLGSYTCQIFWKGDPGIENFIIRFTSEDMMKKWAQQIEAQRRRFRERARNSDGSRTGGTSQTEFEFMRNQPNLENPYARPGEDDEDDSETLVGSNAPSWVGPGQPYSNGHSDLSQSRNASNTSLRSRSTTSESTGPPPSAAAQSRAQPPRMPSGSFTNQPSLSLRTRNLQALASPAERFGGDSYFSPAPESPMTASSSRTSSSSNMYPFPRQPLPQNGYYEEGHGGTRFTAPAMGRPPPTQRDTNGSISGGYPGAPAQRPGPRAGGAAGMHSAQQLPMAAHRNRSASSPDIHNAQRAGPTGPQPPVPAMPANYQGFTHSAVPRSQTNSPNGVPSRSPPGPSSGYGGTSPISQHPYDPVARPDLRGAQYPSSRTITPVPRTGGTPVPPPSTGTPLPADVQPPTQLKVKVHAPSAAQVLTLVVPMNISYQTLKDRIDAKLQRSTNLTLGTVNGGTGVVPSKDNVVKLKYLDEDDYVTIQTDEDVLEAFETWREQRGGDLGADGMGSMGEIELFCQR